jgi:hypothetical protein
LLSVTVLTVAACAPHVSTLYTGPGVPVPRADSAAVEVFLEGSPPERAYTVLGEVLVTTDLSRRKTQELLDSAKVQARKLGGDALVDVGFTSQATVEGTDKSTHSGTRRILKGKVVAWK